MGIKLLSVMVSDAGPLIHLAQISKLHLLKKLFNRVIITPNVKRRLSMKVSSLVTLTR